MHRIIGDKATPKTGGVTNQCPHHHRIMFRAWHFEFRACLGFRASDFGFPPTSRGVLCETKPHQIERTPQACHLYLTPVFQPGIPSTPKKNETNPISASRPTIHHSLLTTHYFTKTNPIYPTTTRPTTKIHETNPICPLQFKIDISPPNTYTDAAMWQLWRDTRPCTSC